MNWATVLQTVSAVVASLSFAYGVNAWRRTSVGQRRIDLAVRTLIAFNRAKQAIHEVRFPGSTSREGLSKWTEGKEPGSDIERQAYIAIERLDKRAERFTELEAVKLEFQAIFGREIDQSFAAIEEVRRDIIRASLRLEHHWKQQGQPFRTEQEQQHHLARMHEAEAIIWEGFDTSDPINARVQMAVDQMEEYCRHVIDPAATFADLRKGYWRRLKRYWGISQ